MPMDKKVEDLIEFFFVNVSNASANAVILKRGVVQVVDDDSPNGNGNAVAPATFSSARISFAAPAAALLSAAEDEEDREELPELA
jgi:hypothetical protein